MELKIAVDTVHVQRVLEATPEKVAAAVEQALGRGAQEVARSARRHAPKAFSTLTQSIRADRVGELHYQVVAGTNYARAVEEGRRPGSQPGTAQGLTEWVQQKTGASGTALDRLTHLVARAIGRRGIRPQPYMRPALEEGESRLRALVKGAVARVAREAARG